MVTKISLVHGPKFCPVIGLTILRVQGRDASATNVLAENEELNTSMLLTDYNLVSQREPGSQVM